MRAFAAAGGGVSKAGGNHGFSNNESHFWCCMGSGIEAFTRMHASVFYARPSLTSKADASSAATRVRELFVLQHISSGLVWDQAGCNVTLYADAVGDPPAGAPMVSTLRVSPMANSSAAAQHCALLVRMRVPGWASHASAEALLAEGTVPVGSQPEVLGQPAPRSFVSRTLRSGEGLRLRLWTRPALRLPSADAMGRATAAVPSTSAADQAPRLFGDGGSTVRFVKEPEAKIDGRSARAVLRGVTYGPLLLAALTDGERTLRAHTATAVPVASPAPPEVSSAVDAWLTPVPDSARWQLATLELVDSSVGLARAVLASHSVVEHAVIAAVEEARRKSHGEDGLRDCLQGRPGTRVLAHAGVKTRVGATARPLQPPALTHRRGGSDAVNAATWRIASAEATGRVAGRPAVAHAGDGAVVIEAFDRPGLLLSVSARVRVGGSSTRVLHLLPAQLGGAVSQRWRMHSVEVPESKRDAGCSTPASLTFALESLESPGLWVRAAATAGGSLEVAPVGELGAGAMVAAFTVRTPLALYPPLAHWAFSNTSCAATQSAECRRTYLMVPLRELLDETYSSHLCVLPPDAAVAPPAFCH